MPVDRLIIAILILLLLVAAWQDIRSRRIPNVLVFSGAMGGVLLNSLLPQEMGGLGVLDSLAGLGIGLALLLPLYLLRAMGAGDVKLMAMTGAFLGVQGTIIALLYVLLVGGVLALAVTWYQGNLRRLLHSLKTMLFIGAARGAIGSLPAPDAGLPGMPYGVAIAVGTAAYLAVTHWG